MNLWQLIVLAELEADGEDERVLPCLTADMVWSLIRLGYLGDERFIGQ